MIYYDEQLGIAQVVFEVQDSKGKIKRKEIYSGKPIYIQRHPSPHGKYYIVQIHFEGEIPAWINKYAEYEKLNVVKSSNPLGFGLIQIERDLATSPMIKHLIHDWFQDIHEDDETMIHYRDKILDNIKIVEMNLIHYSEIFNELGLHFRREDNGQGAAMSFVNFPTRHKFETLKPEQQTAWEQLVEALTLKRNYPVPIDVENEETNDISTDDEVIEVKNIVIPIDDNEEQDNEPNEINTVEEIHILIDNSENHADDNEIIEIEDIVIVTEHEVEGINDDSEHEEDEIHVQVEDIVIPTLDTVSDNSDSEEIVVEIEGVGTVEENNDSISNDEGLEHRLLDTDDDKKIDTYDEMTISNIDSPKTKEKQPLKVFDKKVSKDIVEGQFMLF